MAKKGGTSGSNNSNNSSGNNTSEKKGPTLGRNPEGSAIAGNKPEKPDTGNWQKYPFGDYRGDREKWANRGQEKSEFASWREEVEKIKFRRALEAGDYETAHEIIWGDPSDYILFGGGKRGPTLFSDIDPRAFDHVDLSILARAMGYEPKSTIDGKHGKLGFHLDGRAVDIRVKGPDGKQMSNEQISKMKADFEKYGLFVYDETIAENLTPESDGAHIHVDTRSPIEARERRTFKDYDRANPTKVRSRAEHGLNNDWPPRRR